jgi:hypothetical protein
VSSSGTIKFACVFLHDGRNSNPQAAERLTSALEEKSARLNFPLASVTGRGAVVSVAFGGRNLRERLYSEFARLKASGARIVVVVLGEKDFYGEVKVCGDAQCLPTQVNPLNPFYITPIKPPLTTLLLNTHYSVPVLYVGEGFEAPGSVRNERLDEGERVFIKGREGSKGTVTPERPHSPTTP